MSEKHECAGTVSGDWRSYPCSRSGKYEEGGKWWCGVHAPSRVKAKAEKLRAKWEAESAQRRAEWSREAALAAATEALVQAAVAYTLGNVDHNYLDMNLRRAAAAYRKAKGEGA